MFLKEFLRSLSSKIIAFSENKGVAAVILALLLPALIASIYYAVNFAERTGSYTYVDEDNS